MSEYAMREWGKKGRNLRSGKKTGGSGMDFCRPIGNQAYLQLMKEPELEEPGGRPVIQRYPCDDLRQAWEEAPETVAAETTEAMLKEIKVALDEMCERTAKIGGMISKSDGEVKGEVLDFTVELLKTANRMSWIADKVLAENKENKEFVPGKVLYEILRSLWKFPNVILPADAKLSLETLPDILRNVLGEEAAAESEIGLFRLADGEDITKTQGMGLMLGRKAEGRMDVGAYVSSPGSGTFGFKNSQAAFIAHTHPIGAVGRAKKSELNADKQAVKNKRMEMVLRSDKQSLLLYDEEQVYNQSHVERFVDELALRLSQEVLLAQFGIKKEEWEHGWKEEWEEQAAKELDQAVDAEYDEAKKIHSKLKTNFFSADEYEERLATLHQKLKNTTDSYSLKLFLSDKYPDNQFVKRKKEKDEQEETDEDIFGFLDGLDGVSFGEEEETEET